LKNIDPLHAILWTLRRNEKDVIHLYDTLSTMMELSTGARMLNFGYWKGNVLSPEEAQSQLCSSVGVTAELDTAQIIVDVGSGYGAPASQWERQYTHPLIVCVNTNSNHLTAGKNHIYHIQDYAVSDNAIRNYCKISFINSSSMALPFSNSSVDRVISLESAQHFKPFAVFISESARILSNNGLLVIAMPVTIGLRNSFESLIRLGILNFTWASEHYSLNHVLTTIEQEKFTIIDITMIGPDVYEPLAKYYFKNRQVLRNKILTEYPSYVERILFKSLLKMQNVSRKGIVDYVIIKARRY
jgi:cyclopropane fatty-acyl-phospholipid synthase-like methyltransferase